ncbi:MAG: ubiquinol-cytochrome c reductase iron-sulfur subunit [Thermoleophilia bacterium]|nr:ubiquinol-cytochrome c reductase iron-sulfur subunit [Thermoleophilia bacterium]
MSEATHTPQDDTTAAGGVADKPMTRGQFLTAATVGVGGVMGALLAVPVAGLALGPVFGGEDFEPALLGMVDEFKDGTFTKVVLTPHSDKPDAYVRKKVAFVRRNAKPGDDRFALKGQEDFTVISNTCMHLGCPVQASSSGFVCPCHGGAYDQDGKRIGGPPVRPLDRYIWEQRGDELWATAIYSLKSDGSKATHRDPGQHTSGPEQYFYPLQP